MRPLLPLSERWGVGDDFDRDRLVDEASRDDLESLVAAIEEAPEAVWDWLAGPESLEKHPTKEYVAVTCLTMAADRARLRVARA